MTVTYTKSLATFSIYLSPKKLSRSVAAKLYNVPKLTLRDRMNGKHPMGNYWLAAYILTEIEEEVVVEYILDLDVRGFTPRIDNV